MVYRCDAHHSARSFRADMDLALSHRPVGRRGPRPHGRGSRRNRRWASPPPYSVPHAHPPHSRDRARRRAGLPHGSAHRAAGEARAADGRRLPAHRRRAVEPRQQPPLDGVGARAVPAALVERAPLGGAALGPGPQPRRAAHPRALRGGGGGGLRRRQQRHPVAAEGADRRGRSRAGRGAERRSPVHDRPPGRAGDPRLPRGGPHRGHHAGHGRRLPARGRAHRRGREHRGVLVQTGGSAHRRGAHRDLLLRRAAPAGGAPPRRWAS